MALTIHHQPQQFTPAYNEIVFVTSGTNNTQANYKYICDVYFPGSVTYDIRQKVSPRPDGYGLFDIHTAIRDYVSSDIATQTSGNDGFKQNTNSYKSFTVKFGEEYGTNPTVYPDLTTSGTIYAWNASFDYLDFKDYNQTSYLLLDNTTRSFLTNAPTTQYIFSNENAWLYMMTNTTTAVSQMLVTTYDSSESVIDTYRINNPYTTDKFLRFPSGTNNLNNIPNSAFALGSQSIITASVAFYKIKVLEDTLFSASQEMIYIIQSNCSKYASYRLHFLNKLGGFDSFTFNKLSRQNSEIERNTYKKTYGSVSSTGVWSYNKSDRGIVPFSTREKPKILLNSDWITETQAEWLLELISSPEVYWDDSNTLIAVNILNTSYEKKKTVNEKLIQITLEIEITQYNYRQSY